MPAATELVDPPPVRALARLFRHGGFKPESPGGGGAAPGSRTDNRRTEMVRSGPVMQIVARRVLWECVDTTHAGEKEEPPPSNPVVAVFQTDGRGGARAGGARRSGGHEFRPAGRRVLGRSSATLRTF